MRSELRTLRTLPAVLVLVLAGVAVVAAPVARADDDELAGTRAGEGRAHPGRTGEPDVVPPAASAAPVPSRPPGRPDGPATPAPSAAATPDARQSQDAYDAEPNDAVPTGRALRVLPMGTGLALMGLGLGLAFLGLRLRRH